MKGTNPPFSVTGISNSPRCLEDGKMTNERSESHTPGPWRVVEQGQGYTTVVGPDSANPADARLIAAAPEMRELLHECGEHISDPRDSRGYQERADELLEKLRALLARVEGGGQ